ncbi:hypothetical protein [Hyphomicrobium denitrificans]|uniref:hypothetical protein n=1 Tax=Hyphomicrobium denitrificans TaxID=53399 RepID=UPI00022E2B13|nr:hypothetical protein [Hyphomicrobium denitrificans]
MKLLVNRKPFLGEIPPQSFAELAGQQNQTLASGQSRILRDPPLKQHRATSGELTQTPDGRKRAKEFTLRSSF